MTREEKRLRRQFAVIERLIPFLRRPIKVMQNNRYRLIRIPIAIILCLGSVLAILPFLGLWMLPLGLLLLAVDLPFLQPFVNAVLIRGRRRIEIWRRWWRNRKG